MSFSTTRIAFAFVLGLSTLAITPSCNRHTSSSSTSNGSANPNDYEKVLSGTTSIPMENIYNQYGEPSSVINNDMSTNAVLKYNVDGQEVVTATGNKDTKKLTALEINAKTSDQADALKKFVKTKKIKEPLFDFIGKGKANVAKDALKFGSTMEMDNGTIRATSGSRVILFNFSSGNTCNNIQVKY